MTPQEKALLVQLSGQLARLEKSGVYLFSKDIQMANGMNIQLNGKTGTKIGTDALQKLGFYVVAYCFFYLPVRQ